MSDTNRLFFNNFLIQLSVSIIIHILQLRMLICLKEVKSPKDEEYFLKEILL